MTSLSDCSKSDQQNNTNLKQSITGKTLKGENAIAKQTIDIHKSTIKHLKISQNISEISTIRLKRQTEKEKKFNLKAL